MIQEANPTALQHEQDEIKAITEWVRASCRRLPRSLTALTPQDAERRRALGSSSYDTISIAKESASVIMADDFGLRRLARDEHGLVGFSTFAALRLANERGLLDDTQLSHSVETLVELNHDFVPVWPEMVLTALSDTQFQITPRIVRLFDHLGGSRSDLEPAVRVGIGVLRKVALSVAGDAVLEAVAALCFKALRADRGRGVFKRIAAEIRSQTLLLPLVSDRLIRALNGFLAAEALGGSHLI